LVLLHAIPSALHPIFYGTMSKVIWDITSDKYCCKPRPRHRNVAN
jgi:hypothetical protein